MNLCPGAGEAAVIGFSEIISQLSHKWSFGSVEYKRFCGHDIIHNKSTQGAQTPAKASPCDSGQYHAVLIRMTSKI